MPANAEDSRDASLIPESGRSPGGGHGNPLQYFCLEKKVPTEEPGRLQSIGSQRVRRDWSDMVCMHIFITDGYTITYQVNTKFFSEKAMAPHSSTLAWKIPWTEEPGRLQSMGLLESDTTERLHFHFSLSCIGEGNDNLLRCFCLQNPRDGGA